MTTKKSKNQEDDGFDYVLKEDEENEIAEIANVETSFEDIVTGWIDKPTNDTVSGWDDE